VLLRSFKDVCLFSAGCADNFSFYKKQNKIEKIKHKECFKVSCWNRRKILTCDIVIKNSLDSPVHIPLQSEASFNNKKNYTICVPQC